MKVEFSKVFKDMEGEAIINDGVPATLKVVAVNSLIATYADEQNLSGEEKLKRWKLAQRINNNETDCSVEEVALIKKLIGKAYNTIIVGQAYEMLEG